jgi:hypothetical protein
MTGMGAAVNDSIHIEIQMIKLGKEGRIRNDFIDLRVSFTDPSIKLQQERLCVCVCVFVLCIVHGMAWHGEGRGGCIVVVKHHIHEINGYNNKIHIVASVCVNTLGHGHTCDFINLLLPWEHPWW